MRVNLEPETAFIGKKFAYIFLVVIFELNSIIFLWYFFFLTLIGDKNYHLLIDPGLMYAGLSFFLKI